MLHALYFPEGGSGESIITAILSQERRMQAKMQNTKAVFVGLLPQAGAGLWCCLVLLGSLQCIFVGCY